MEEFMNCIADLDENAIKHLIRLAIRLSIDDGFTQAYAAYIDQHSPDIQGIERFIEEWEASHDR